jgi:nitrate reductase NapE
MQPDLGQPMRVEITSAAVAWALVFFVLAIAVWPVVAVGVAGGWGFAVWMYQQAYGPPGPPQR